jgi:hypothetical protein
MKAFGITAAAAMALTAQAFAGPGDLGGTYRIDGMNINGTPYGGTATITVTSANTCRIVWRTGNETSSGICMRNENAFSAGYVLQDKVGLVIYEIQPDGSLVGLWTIADQPGVGKERLIPVR